MTTIEENAKAEYAKATPPEKAMLERIHGKSLFVGKIIDRVKSVEDAIREVPPSEEMLTLLNYSGSDPEMIFTSNVAKRNYFAKVLKDGAILDYGPGTPPKWYCWFKKTVAGFGFSCALCADGDSYATVGSRLSFPDQETANHFGNCESELHNLVLSHN